MLKKGSIRVQGGVKKGRNRGLKTTRSGLPFCVKKAGGPVFEKVATLEKCHFATLIQYRGAIHNTETERQNERQKSREI